MKGSSLKKTFKHDFIKETQGGTTGQVVYFSDSQTQNAGLFAKDYFELELMWQVEMINSLSPRQC